MTEDLLTRDVPAIDLVRILEDHFGYRIRGLVPLREIRFNGTLVVIDFKGVKVAYEEPMGQGFRDLMARSEREGLESEGGGDEGSTDASRASVGSSD